MRPSLARGPLAALLVVLLAALAVLPSPAGGAETGEEPDGRVLPRELRCAVLAVKRARVDEQLALLNIQDLLDGVGTQIESIALAEDHLHDALEELDAVLSALASFAVVADLDRYDVPYFVEAERRIEEIRRVDAFALERLEQTLSGDRLRSIRRSLTVAVELKSELEQVLLGVERPVRPRDTTSLAPEERYIPVHLQFEQGVQYSFGGRSVDSTGLQVADVNLGRVLTLPRRLNPRIFRKRAAKISKTDRALGFTGTSKKEDGFIFLRPRNTLRGPFQVEFTAGLFKKAKKKHNGDAFVSVEFDVDAEGPLDFFVVSTRYVPGDGLNPSGVQVFANSTGGAFRGNTFLEDVTAADVRVVFENDLFEVFVRPFGGAEEDFASIATFAHASDGVEWELGVGGARLRKGTLLGIDDLQILPR